MNKEEFENIESIVSELLSKKMIELQPFLGRFSTLDAPFLLFAIDAYREEIVKRIPEAEGVAEEMKRRFGTKTLDYKELEMDDGKKVKYMFKRGKR